MGIDHQGIAIIGEFCCRWLISVFDISVAQFAEEQHQMSSFEFSMASALGSIINTFQTGWLFNRFLSWDISIPMITSLCGVAGGRSESLFLCVAIGVMICVYSTSKAADFIASLFILMAYGFAAPTAPTIMSVCFGFTYSIDGKLCGYPGYGCGLGIDRWSVCIYDRTLHPECCLLAFHHTSFLDLSHSLYALFVGLM